MSNNVMDKFFVKYRKLEDELANPITTFMRATFQQLHLDIKEEAYTDYTDYTHKDVEDLLDGDKERWYIIYSRHERAFCESQYLKNPISCNIPHNAHTAVSEDGYEPDTDEEPSNREDGLIKQLQWAILQNNEAMYVQLVRMVQKERLKYLAHRIKLQARELLNARQFIMQAEVMISERSEQDKRQLERLRKTYGAYKKRVSYANLSNALAYAENMDTVDADKFGETFTYESEYF